MELMVAAHAAVPTRRAPRLGSPKRLRRQQPDREAFRERGGCFPSVPERRRSPCSSKPLNVASLVAVLVLGIALRTASAWEDCVVSPNDKWKPATERTPALKMRYEFQRRYTCSDERASFLAGSFRFDSPCMANKFFFPPDVRSCLKGRRVIFLGDSLSNQQGDSLLGMLGWHLDWMVMDHPKNAKQAVDDDGNKYFTLIDCWHPAVGGIGGVERCYDYYSRDFPATTSSEMTKDYFRPKDVPGKPDLEGRVELSEQDEMEAEAADADASAENHNRRLKRGRRSLTEEEEGDGGGEGEEEDEEHDGISVHMRMFSRPNGEHWLQKAMRDYNETRPSDVIVVNFGGHYHDGKEDEETFKRDVFPILDDMAELGKNATVVWREIAPTHFPAVNGSFDEYDSLEDKPKNPCCTGVPPKVYDRNVIVEEYLRDNGFLDTVKLLRIYDMSATRGAAHHTCNLAPPSTMDQGRARNTDCHPLSHAIDCRHWSETGVVEEWNALLLSHVCPVGK